jgi:hypothetical protein
MACRLQQAGFDPAKPTVWVVEGLIYYLEPADARKLLQVRGPRACRRPMPAPAWLLACACSCHVHPRHKRC